MFQHLSSIGAPDPLTEAEGSLVQAARLPAFGAPEAAEAEASQRRRAVVSVDIIPQCRLCGIS